MQAQVSGLIRRSAAALAVLTVGLLAATSPARAAENVRAVWQVQEISLPYFGLTTQYSCDGLRDTMNNVLRQLGVRDDLVTVAVSCAELNGPTRNPSIWLVIANPVPASDEVAKSFASDPKRAELLAKLQRHKKSPVSDAPFDAVLKHVVLRAKDRSGAGASGDCELLEQVRDRVLPKLGAKIIKDEMRCTPYQGTIGNPKLEVELLVAASPKT
jgi:hypothetical protein